jgi:hypothetical protein
MKLVALDFFSHWFGGAQLALVVACKWFGFSFVYGGGFS